MSKLEELTKALDEARGARLACDVEVLYWENKVRLANVELSIVYRELDDAVDALYDAENALNAELKRVKFLGKEKQDE